MQTIPESPNYKDCGVGGPHGPCIVCGREVKTQRPNFLRVHGGGIYAVTEDEAESMDRAGDCGLQPIGPECLRRYPELKPYATKGYVA
jgi:hypothetical protein